MDNHFTYITRNVANSYLDLGGNFDAVLEAHMSDEVVASQLLNFANSDNLLDMFTIPHTMEETMTRVTQLVEEVDISNHRTIDEVNGNLDSAIKNTKAVNDLLSIIKERERMVSIREMELQMWKQTVEKEVADMRNILISKCNSSGESSGSDTKRSPSTFIPDPECISTTQYPKSQWTVPYMTRNYYDWMDYWQCKRCKTKFGDLIDKNLREKSVYCSPCSQWLRRRTPAGLKKPALSKRKATQNKVGAIRQNVAKRTNHYTPYDGVLNTSPLATTLPAPVAPQNLTTTLSEAVGAQNPTTTLPEAVPLTESDISASKIMW
ncbi:hypothetical protein M427DRAFT_50225 [Gonapodya prolifera JEL478]|uniref:Uncharacterized protein n=1 Tax=Gonapodya prolifera (strain JEL478) TaxID=1344416 RepID=A0A138ZWK2_GONPJ|nr:hypothetical protein M427DRAFT_50225 [Gonapodya prolifera JEL478]|eukprot:KXS08900.1 hypothetical protein M427DRAFT_50225 [Gonapodya prolifera JEL478]